MRENPHKSNRKPSGMKRYLVLFVLLNNLLQSQAQKYYSAKEAYADSLLAKADAVFFSNPDSSVYYANLVLDYALKNNLEVRKALAWRALAKNDVLKGDVENALKRLREAIIIFEKFKRPENVAKCYTLMSIAFGKIHNDKESISLLLKAIEIYERIGNKAGLRNSLVNLSNSYADIKDYDKALEVLKESKPFIEDGSGEWFYYYINSGIINKSLKKFELAKIQLDSCLVISHRNKMVDAEVTALTVMADLLLETKKFKEAIIDYNKAITMARKNTLPVEEVDALEGLVKSYEFIGEFKNAYYAQVRHKIISDSLFNLEKIKNLNNIEARLKVSEKEKTIAMQQLSIDESVLEQERNKNKIEYLVTGSLILIIILFFTYYTYLKVKKQKAEIEIQKARAEKLNQLNQKIFAVISHDFKSPLITLNMLLDLMDKENISKEDVSAYTADVRNQIAQSGQILENLLNWAKSELNIAQNNEVITPTHITVIDIIKEMEYLKVRKNIKIINAVSDQIKMKLPPDILKIVLRNLTSNAIKFSHTNSEVIIGSDEHGNVFVKDQGIGIDENSINHLFNGTVKSKLGTFNETGFGLGLHITFELIQKFGGKLWVEKNQPTGTVFKFSINKNE